MRLWVSRCNSQVLYEYPDNCFTCSVGKPDVRENENSGTECTNFVEQWIKKHKAVEALFDGQPWPTENRNVRMIDFEKIVEFEPAFMEPSTIPTFYARTPSAHSLFVQFFVRRAKSGRHICHVRLREDRGGVPAFLILEH